MHIARQKRNHARISRGHVPLEARAPAFITLPISMPSIPILGPLITHFIAGTNRPVTATSTPIGTPARETTLTPAPTAIPAPTPTPTPPVSDNSENSPGDSGRSNAGSSTSRSNDGNTSTAVNVADSTSVGTGISTEFSPQPSDASGNASTGGNESSDGPNGDSASNPSTSIGSNLNGSPANAVGDVNPTSGSNSPGGLIIGGTADTVSSKATASSVEGFSGSTALPDPSSATNTGASASNNFRGGLSGGAIGGMVIVITLGLLVVIIILLRGRHRQRRSERRNQWWTRSGTRLSTDSDSTVIASRLDRASVRSSFETAIDHTQTPRPTISLENVPSLPPMAEVRGSNNIQLFSPNSAIPDSPMLIAFDNSQAPVTTTANNRTSIHSFASSSSGSHYLVIPGNGDKRETSSPVSVRPFSPSESFSFPMPPKAQSGDWSPSRPMSTVTLHSTSRSLNNGPAIAPALPSNPFADPSNPFSDPVSPTAEFAEVESIRRPFKGTRHDELTVTNADGVKVLRLFDDGWALVEKLPAFEDILANQGKNVRGVQGLIPIDCFRAAGQDLSTFFSEKRVSSILYQGHTNSLNAVVAI